LAFSFPYPVLAASPRPPGQGCLSCVHKTYCPAMYWLRRYQIEGRTIDNHNGIQCASWSNNMADQVKTTPTEDDLDEEDYMYIQGLGSEPDRCGLTDAVTASNRNP
jgi:hypothetical protein